MHGIPATSLGVFRDSAGTRSATDSGSENPQRRSPSMARIEGGENSASRFHRTDGWALMVARVGASSSSKAKFARRPPRGRGNNFALNEVSSRTCRGLRVMLRRLSLVASMESAHQSGRRFPRPLPPWVSSRPGSSSGASQIGPPFSRAKTTAEWWRWSAEQTEIQQWWSRGSPTRWRK